VGTLNTTAPNLVNLEEIQFYKLKNNYSSKDYWIKDKMDEGTVYDVLEYYKNFLTSICGNNNIRKEEEHQIAWVFGDFEINKRQNHIDFVKYNKKFYASYLLNDRKEVIHRMNSQVIHYTLNNYSINEHRNIRYYCYEIVSLHSYS